MPADKATDAGRDPHASFADPIAMQHRLFAELSAMFGREVPLYDKALLVNRVVNEAVISLLALRHRGFGITPEQLEKTSGERHGAIRIGTAEEYRWVAGFFAAFGMLPHNFYDMTALGGKSQPIIATAFRSPANPEHRVFTSLLVTEGFAPAVRARVEGLLARRQVISGEARALIEKNETEGGLSPADAEALVREGATRIFKWTGHAHDHALYAELCDAGLKIAADIACFQSHHLNHLTPNTLWIDLYTAAMKHTLGELDQQAFSHAAATALAELRAAADADYLRLHFRHLTAEEIDGFASAEVADEEVTRMAAALAARLAAPDLDLSKLPHSGFKDFTEGPPTGVPVLLRQDSYKALTEPVVFHEADGSTIEAKHTARFGEIEQRFYATTPAGRKLYDDCLAEADAARERDPGLAKRDYTAYLAAYSAGFARFPRTLAELRNQGLVFCRYFPTEKGRAAAAAGELANGISNEQLLANGHLRFEGLRYEDFLPFSAAGIFASNLGQYGTKVDDKRTYEQADLEAIMGRDIIDPTQAYARMESESLTTARAALGIA